MCAIVVRMSTTRQTITFTKPQLDHLRTEAEALGISVSDLVRRIIDKDRRQSTLISPHVMKSIGDYDLLTYVDDATSACVARQFQDEFYKRTAHYLARVHAEYDWHDRNSAAALKSE